MLLLGGQQVRGAEQAHVLALLVDDGEEAVAALGHHLAGVVDGGVHAHLEDALGEHLGAHRDGHGDEARGGVGVIGRGDDRAPATLGGGDDAARHLGAAADHKAARLALNGELLRLVAVGHQDDVARLDRVLHHLGRGAHADVAALDARRGVAKDHLAVERVDDAGVAGARVADHRVVEDVHVGVGDVLDRDEALEGAVLVGDAEGVDLGLAHEVPGGEEAHLPVDAALALNLGVLDLRGDGGDELGLLEAKALEDKGRLAVDGARAARLVDGGVLDGVLEVCVADGRADAVRVRMQVADDVDLADSLRHGCSLRARVGCACDDCATLGPVVVPVSGKDAIAHTSWQKRRGGALWPSPGAVPPRAGPSRPAVRPAARPARGPDCFRSESFWRRRVALWHSAG